MHRLNHESRRTDMSTLVVVGYDEPFKADEVLLKLRKLQREYLLDLEDAAVAIKDEHGKVKLHQTLNLTAAGRCQRRLLGVAHWPDLPQSPAGFCRGCGNWRYLRGAYGCGNQ
jgi:hypothetical protein